MNDDQESLTNRLRALMKDGVDYLASVAALIQVRLIELTLSGVVFVGFLFVAGLMALAAFVFFNIAAGLWLTRWTNNAGLSLLMMGGFYLIIAIVLGGLALKWLKQLRS